jgi:hypothetical protein
VLLASFDEKTQRHVVAPVHPLSGQPLAGYAPIDLGRNYSWALSPAGGRLAVVIYPSNDHPVGGVLHLVDLSQWRSQATAITLDDFPAAMAWNSDGTRLAIGVSRRLEHRLLIVDALAGTLAAEAEVGFYVSRAAFTPDGQWLLAYGRRYATQAGTNAVPTAARLSAATLAVDWQTELAGVKDGQYVPPGAANVHDESVWWQPGLALVPERQVLYVVQADSDRLTTVDFAAHTAGTVRVGPAQSWLDRLLALTAGVAEAKMMNGTLKNAVYVPAGDGGVLYVVGEQVDTTNAEFTRTLLDLQVIDAATGVELARHPAAASRAFLAPGGQHLVLSDWWGETPQSEVRALDALAKPLPFAGVELRPGATLGGQTLLVAQRGYPTQSHITVFDPATFAPLADWWTESMAWLLIP